MKTLFADRMNVVQKSFVREILKCTVKPEVISFAGGLPNPASFPIEEIAEASQQVLSEDGANALQYSTTEGYLPLRQQIAKRYEKRFGLKIDPEEILITNGSQQGLDLLAKVFLNKGDDVLIERPGYLGAIQALSLYEPTFRMVTLNDGGVDLEALEKVLTDYHPKFFYGVPNFQNPSGRSYTAENREKAAEILRRHDTLFVEDDPYGELRFSGTAAPSMKNYLGEDCILLGTFSKIVSPAMRLGWICARKEIMEKLVTAKQGTDLHTNFFTQRVVSRYLEVNDLDAHIEKIREMYKAQCGCMTAAIGKYFPPEVKCTIPEGGMFLWVTLPEGMSSTELFDHTIAENVAFVPGEPFYVGEQGGNTLRLNYTNSDPDKIEEGIRRMGNAIRKMMESEGK